MAVRKIFLANLAKEKLIELCKSNQLETEGTNVELRERLKAINITFLEEEIDDTDEKGDTDIKELKKDVEALRIRNELQKEKLKLLAEQDSIKIETAKKQKELDEILGIKRVCNIPFTLSEAKELSKYNANPKKKIYYECFLEPRTPMETISCAGQSFAKKSLVRSDGICKICNEELGLPDDIGVAPIQAGFNKAKCPRCDSLLVFEEESEASREINQRYEDMGGVKIFCIAKLSHEQKFKIPRYDRKKNIPLEAIYEYKSKFIRVRFVQIDEEGKTAQFRDVDLKKIYEHYKDTCQYDGNGNITVEGKKEIFFKEVAVTVDPEVRNVFGI